MDGEYLDTLKLRDAVLARDLVLQEDAPERFVLHRVEDCRARPLGAFPDAAAAWTMIDAVDDAAGRPVSSPPLAFRAAAPTV